MQASTFKSAVGPSLAWFDEHIRYERLFTTSPDGSVARRFAVLTLLLRAGRVGGNVVAQGPDSRHRARAEPTHRRHHHHLVPGDDVHPDQVDPPLRRVRRPRGIARRAGRGRRHRRGDEVAAQPRHVRRRGAVRDGVVVRHASTAGGTSPTSVCRGRISSRSGTSASPPSCSASRSLALLLARVVPLLRPGPVADRPGAPVAANCRSPRWRLPRGSWCCSRCCR